MTIHSYSGLSKFFLVNTEEEHFLIFILKKIEVLSLSRSCYFVNSLSWPITLETRGSDVSDTHWRSMGSGGTTPLGVELRVFYTDVSCFRCGR